MNTLQRLRYHGLRFRSAFWYGGGTLFIFMFLMLVAFPNDDETIAAFIGLLGQIGVSTALGIDVDAPGFTLWISIFSGTYLFMIIAVTAIRMGARVLPTRQDDGIELLLGSQPKTGSRILLENWISSQLVLLVLILPTFIMTMLFAIYFGAADIILRLLTMSLFTYAMGTFFLVFTMMLSVISFRRSWGIIGGFVYFIYAIIIMLSSSALNPLINDNLNLDFTLDISVINVNIALDPAGGLIDNQWNWLELAIVMAMVVMMVGLSLFRANSPDYIEKSGGGHNFLRFLPTFSSSNKLSKKFPLIAEQLRQDRNLIFIYLFIMIIFYPYEMLLFDLVYRDDPAAFAELINGFDIGFFSVLLGGYEVPGSYTGFSVTQFFALSWLYFGIFIFIAAINIPSRDVNTSSQDLVYANAITQRQVILSRVIAMLLSFFVITIIAMLSNLISGYLFGFDRNLGREILVFLVTWLFYSGVGVFLVGLTMIPAVRWSKRVGFWTFMLMILIYIQSNLVSSLENLQYLSVITYLDTAGIILDKVDLIDQFLGIIGMWVIAIGTFFVGLQLYERKDMI